MPYGGKRNTGTIASSKSHFTDQEWEPETGLYNYDARLYDPVIGRFVSADTVVQNLFDPQFINGFAYVRNNPILFTDPTGHYVPEVGPGNHMTQEDLARDIEQRIESGRGFADNDQVLGGVDSVSDRANNMMELYVNSLNAQSYTKKKKYDKVKSMLDSFKDRVPDKIPGYSPTLIGSMGSVNKWLGYSPRVIRTKGSAKIIVGVGTIALLTVTQCYYVPAYSAATAYASVGVIEVISGENIPMTPSIDDVKAMVSPYEAFVNP